MGVFVISTCKGKDSPVAPVAGSASLSVLLTAGAQGQPSAGTDTFPNGTGVAYGYAASAGFDSVRVTFDGVAVPAVGTVKLSRSHVLMVSGVQSLVAPAGEAAKVDAIREIWTSPDPVAAFQDQLEQMAQLIEALGVDSAARLISVIGASAFDPGRDSAAVRTANAALAAKLYSIDLGEAGLMQQSLAGDAGTPEHLLAGDVPRRVVFLFINGVLNTPFDAVSATASLATVVKEAALGGPITVANYYNESAIANDGTIGACLWNRLQRIGAAPIDGWANIASFCLTDFTEARGQILNLLNQKPTGLAADGVAIAKLVTAQLRSGNAVVFIGHSQGTLIAQQALRVVLSENGSFASCLGYLQVASPLSATIPLLNQTHVRTIAVKGELAHDIILALGLNSDATVATAQSVGADAFLNALMAAEATKNPFKIVGNWTLDKLIPLFTAIENARLHLFSSSYLAELGARRYVRDHIKGIGDAVRSDCPPIPSTLSRVSGDGQTAPVGQALASPFVVRVADAGGTPVEGIPLSFALVSGAGTLSSSDLETNAAGLASTTLTLGAAPGQTVVRVSSVRMSGTTVDFTATAVEPSRPAIKLSSSTIAFAAALGENSPSQTIQITNTGTGTLTGLSTSVTYQGSVIGWLSTSLSGASAPATLTLTASASTLSAGSYNATISVASSVSGVTNSPQDIVVSLIVSPEPTAPTITISSPTASFAAIAGGVNPSNQTVQVTNGGAGALSGLAVGTITYGAAQPTGWLAAALDVTTAPATLTLSVTTGALAAGTYTATVPVSSTSSGVTNSPRTVSVAFTVSSAPIPPVIGLSSSSLVFSGISGGPNPTSQETQITNAGGGALSGLGIGEISFAAGQPTGWLSASLSTTTAPAALTVIATTGALPPGTYSATIPVASGASGVTNSPQSISVQFNIEAPLPPINIVSVERTFALSGTTIVYSSNSLFNPIAGGDIRRITIAGGSGALLLNRDSTSWDYIDTDGVSAFASGSRPSKTQLWRIPLDGSSSTVLADSIAGPIQVTDGYVYFVDLVKNPPTGTWPYTIRRIAIANNVVSDVVPAVDGPTPAFTVADGLLYYVDNGNTIRRVSVQGGASTPLVSVAGGTSLLVAGGRIFWGDNSGTRSIPIEGGAIRLDIPEISNPRTHDDRFLYYVRQVPPYYFNELWRFDLSDSSKRRITGTFGIYSPVAVDDSYVYFLTWNGNGFPIMLNRASKYYCQGGC
jgi:hypothetical protein